MSDDLVVDVIEVERQVIAEKGVQELEEEEEAQAGDLEQGAEENRGDIDEPRERRLMIQLPRISERREKQYVRFSDD